MKKLILTTLCIMLMSGCAATDTFEQIQDVYVQIPMEAPKEIQIELPADAGSTVLAGQDGRLYFCEGYEIAVETCPSGDLEQTIKGMTGYEREDIAVFETAAAVGVKRYEFVWTSAGEGGEIVCRAVIMDDGLYHYCVSLTALSSEAGSLQEAWNEILKSVAV